MIEQIVDNDFHPEAEQAADQSERQHKTAQVATQPSFDDHDTCTDSVGKTLHLQTRTNEHVPQEKPHGRLNVLAKPWPNVLDEFCRDEIYFQDQPSPRAPSNQCEKCGKSFGSNRALNNHVTKEHQRNP